MRSRPFSDLTKNFTPERRARVEATKVGLLSELRAERERSQVTVAEAMGTTQSAISRIERQEDIHLSTLRKYIGATGGRLRVIAEYPDGLFEIGGPDA
jgi:transcriptional regulator with XRE-family HTH domain